MNVLKKQKVWDEVKEDDRRIRVVKKHDFEQEFISEVNALGFYVVGIDKTLFILKNKISTNNIKQINDNFHNIVAGISNNDYDIDYPAFEHLMPITQKKLLKVIDKYILVKEKRGFLK